MRLFKIVAYKVLRKPHGVNTKNEIMSVFTTTHEANEEAEALRKIFLNADINVETFTTWSQDDERNKIYKTREA